MSSQKKEKLVSVIVTAYNQADTISRTLDSILKQNCDFGFEIIIGDDCSTDNTREVCLQYQKKYPDIVRTQFYKTNGGVAVNFVLTINEAKGKYITCCAADDFWQNPDKLQIQIDFLSKNTDYGFVYTEYDKLNVNTGEVTKNWLKTSNLTPYEGDGLIRKFFDGKVPVATHTVMFHKELFDKYVPWEDYIKYNFPIEDWPTWLIISKYTKIGYIPESTATYCVGHESLSHPKKYEVVIKKYTQEKVMYKYLCERFPDDIVFNEKDYDNYVNTILLSLAFTNKDFEKANNYGKVDNYLPLKSFISRNRLLFSIYSILKN